MSKESKNQSPVDSQKSEDLKEKIDNPLETENKSVDAPCEGPESAGDEYDLAEKAFIKSSIAMFFMEKYGMKEFSPNILPKNLEGDIVYQILNADGEQVAAGTLEELVKKAKEEGYHPEAERAARDRRSQPIPPPKAKAKIEGDMKIRWIAFDRRKVLRVIQPFEHGGVQYEAGMIFDWAVLGMKPYHVNRLYNRKVVRHIVEDSRVSYPFRAERKASGKPKAKEVPQGGNQGQNAPTGGENGQNGSPDDNQNQGTAPNGNQPAKFSKKGAHRNK